MTASHLQLSRAKQPRRDRRNLGKIAGTIGLFMHIQSHALTFVLAIAFLASNIDIASGRPQELRAVPIKLGAKNMPAAIPASQIPDVLRSAHTLAGSISQTSIPPGTMVCPYGLWYIQKGKQGFPSKISFVEEGSAAAKAGVKVGDTLLAAGLSNGKIDVMVSRAGKTYSTSIRYFQGKAGTAYTANKLKEKVAQPESIFNMFEVMVLIDYSGSMSTIDCPNDLSRWDWCGVQTIALSQAAARMNNSDVSLVTFDHNVGAISHSKPHDIPQVFRNRRPGGGTFTGKALDKCLSAYFTLRKPGCKPLALAVITDGDTHDEEEMESAIVKATQQMHYPEEVTVCFLQVGEDIEGGKKLAELQTRLRALPAKYSITTYQSFAELKSIGLTQALVRILAAKLKP
jgi:uncharacterized protein YegL